MGLGLAGLGSDLPAFSLSSPPLAFSPSPEKALTAVMATSSNVRMDATEAAAVLARARQGDSEAFRVLVERHSRSVFRLAYRMTGNEQDAEDVVQESFLRAYRQLGRFESRANFGTWLYRIVSNCSVDLMRATGRHDQTRAESLDEAVDLPSNAAPGPSAWRRAPRLNGASAAPCRH